MDTILVVNAGSSSIKFQAFGIEGGELRRLLKGQMDGIGTRPRLVANTSWACSRSVRARWSSSSGPAWTIPSRPRAVVNAPAWSVRPATNCATPA